MKTAHIQLFSTLLSILWSASDPDSESPEIDSAIAAILSLELDRDIDATLQESSTDALLQIAIVQHSILAKAVMVDVVGLWKLFKTVAQTSVDVTLAALENITKVWICNVDNLSCLVQAYTTIIENSEATEVRAAVVTAIADALDSSFDGTDVAKGLLWEIDHIPELLQETTPSPDLANAQLRISGWTMLKEVIFDMNPLPSERVDVWGRVLTSAGDANNVRESSLVA